jgi:hypothetical protein
MLHAEAALRGSEALRKHEQRHGRPVDRDNNPMLDPPASFTAPMLAIWQEVLEAAPPGLLHRADYGLLEALTGARYRYGVLFAVWQSYLLAEPPKPPPAELGKQVRAESSEIGRLCERLGLTWRRRDHLPPQQPEAGEHPDPMFRFQPRRGA